MLISILEVLALSTWIEVPYHHLLLSIDLDRLYELCLGCLLTYNEMSHKMPHSLFLLPDGQRSRPSICHLPKVYRELLEPSLINRVLILNYQFNISLLTFHVTAKISC